MSFSYLLHICWFFFFIFNLLTVFDCLKVSLHCLHIYIHTYNFDDLSINSSHLKISKYLQVNKLFHIDVLNNLMGLLHPALYFSIIMIIFIYLYMAKNWTNRIQFSCYVLWKTFKIAILIWYTKNKNCSFTSF